MADAASTRPTELNEDNHMALALYLIAALILLVGCCCGWVGLSLGRRFGPSLNTRSVGTMTETIPPPPPQPAAVGRLTLRRIPEMTWTTVRAVMVAGNGVFHVNESCGSLAHAGGVKAWKRCLKPECGGAAGEP